MPTPLSWFRGTWRHTSTIRFQLFAAANYQPRVVPEAHEWLTIVGLVAAGMGVSIVPQSFRRLCWEGVSYPTLTGLDRTSIFVGRWTERINPASDRFVEMVRRTFSDAHDK